MRLSWHFTCLALLATLALLCAGCGGINASQSVSPASFFLPGILKADPPATNNAPAAVADLSNQLALVR